MIFAVLDVSLAVNLCINCSFFYIYSGNNDDDDDMLTYLTTTKAAAATDRSEGWMKTTVWSWPVASAAGKMPEICLFLRR